jgi:hypothetical protein
MKKTALTIIAVSMLFALPLSAGAAPLFPNITGVRINGSRLTFANMSGVVHNLNVSIVQVSGNGTLTKDVSIFHKGVETKSLLKPPTLNFIVPDESGRFVEFQDVVVFDDKAALGLRGLLLTPKGNKAFGPADFSLFIPPVVKNGDRIRIDGGAEVTIIVTDKRNPPLGPRGVMLVTNFQPRRVRTQTFRHGTSISVVDTPADVRVSMSAANKKFFLYTSEIPAP